MNEVGASVRVCVFVHGDILLLAAALVKPLPDSARISPGTQVGRRGCRLLGAVGQWGTRRRGLRRRVVLAQNAQQPPTEVEG